MNTKINDEIIKVTIIMATYNAAEHLEQAIKSVIMQSYENIELIVVDGQSTDGTLEILKKYSNYLNYISEKDKGISDAFNKGIEMSTGDFIYFLGADDFLNDSDTVRNVLKGVSKSDLIVCGKIKRVDLSGINTLWIAPKKDIFKRNSLLFRMSLPHQGMFMNKKYFEIYGYFDINNKYSMDYELLLRSYKSFPEVIMKDIIVASWREGGIGNDITLKVYDEYNKIKIKNKVATKGVLVLIDIYIRIKYYIKVMLKKC